MPRRLRPVNIFEAAWLNRFLEDSREFRRFRAIEDDVSQVIVDEITEKESPITQLRFGCADLIYTCVLDVQIRCASNKVVTRLVK
jgi:Lon protease-like protein